MYPVVTLCLSESVYQASNETELGLRSALQCRFHVSRGDENKSTCHHFS